MATDSKSYGDMAAVSRAMVALHKEQFGRGPTRARSHVSGNTLVCVLENVLLPAELKMVEMGQADRVRDSRVAFQTATATEFIAAVEQIMLRKVHAFASAVDPDQNVVWENFTFERQDSEEIPDDL